MTAQRFTRLKQVLDARQPDLTVLLDNVNKAHNFSAILRSCDAVGVLEAHAVWPNPDIAMHHMTSGGTAKWVQVHTHASADDALTLLKDRGFQLLAAHLSENAVDYRSVDYTLPTAIVLGAELLGLGEDARQRADKHITVPMHGMVESLNVSVAAATILFEAERQREANGMYARSRLERERFNRILFEWAHPAVAEYCNRNGFDYPAIDEQGELCEPLPRAGTD